MAALQIPSRLLTSLSTNKSLTVHYDQCVRIRHLLPSGEGCLFAYGNSGACDRYTDIEVFLDKRIYNSLVG